MIQRLTQKTPTGIVIQPAEPLKMPTTNILILTVCKLKNRQPIDTNNEK